MKELELDVTHPVLIASPIGVIRLVKEGNRLIASLLNQIDVEVNIQHPLKITTPVGQLNIITKTNDRRKAALRFPSSWNATKEGVSDRVLDEFLELDKRGVKPKYLLLAPMVNADGYLVGVHPMTRENMVLRMVDEQNDPPAPVEQEEMVEA